MIVSNWDYTIADIAKACKLFIEESGYNLKYNSDNTTRTLWSMYTDPDTDMFVYYVDDSIAGFAIVQKTDEFHTEHFGYINKFYILPEYRRTKAAVKLMEEVTQWFDKYCVVSFATATANIGKDTVFKKLMHKYGYIQNETGILIRNKHEQNL